MNTAFGKISLEIRQDAHFFGYQEVDSNHALIMPKNDSDSQSKMFSRPVGLATKISQ
jgi:hypothetical protein